MALLAILSVIACGGATPEQRLQWAVAQEAAGQNRAAILELRVALQQDPGLSAARLLLGQLFLKVGNPSAAVAELETAARLGEASAELAASLALARVASGEARHAQRVLATFEQIEPSELIAPLTAALGSAYLILGQTELARERLTRLAQRDPTAAQAWLGLARLEMIEGNPPLALSHAEKAFRLDPEVLETAMTLGALREATGDLHGARQAFEDAMALAASREASTVFARTGLVRVLLSDNDFAQAGPILAQVLREYPTWVEANYLQAWSLLKSGEDPQAKPYLERVLQARPDHQDSRYLLALIAFREGRHEQAQDALQRIVARAPADLRARLLLAQVHAQKGMHDDAVRVLRAGLNREGYEPEAAFTLALGQSLMRSGKHEEGLAMLARAAAEAPEAAHIRTQFALAQLASGGSSSAEAALLEATEMAQGFGPPEMLVMFMQVEAGRFGEALASAERFTERYPDIATAYNLLGAAHLANSNVNAARRALRHALKLDASFAPAAVNLALLEAQGGELATARRLLAGVLAKEPGHRSATLAMADLAYAEGDLTSTRHYVQDAWRADRGNEGLSLRWAELLSHEGKHDLAADVLAGLGDDADVSDTVLIARVVAGRRAERIEETVAALQTLLLRHPDDERVLLALTQTLAADGQTEIAQRMLEQHSRKSGAARQPLLILKAKLPLQHQSWAKAEQVLNVLSKGDDADAETQGPRGDPARAAWQCVNAAG